MFSGHNKIMNVYEVLKVLKRLDFLRFSSHLRSLLSSSVETQVFKPGWVQTPWRRARESLCVTGVIVPPPGSKTLVTRPEGVNGG